MDRLQRELEATVSQNENLKLVLESLKAKLEEVEACKEADTKSKDLTIHDLEAKLEVKDEEIESLKSQISLKQKEFDILSSELVNRSKSKFKEIDSLKKQLAEAERTLVSWIIFWFSLNYLAQIWELRSCFYPLISWHS